MLELCKIEEIKKQEYYFGIEHRKVQVIAMLQEVRVQQSVHTAAVWKERSRGITDNGS